MLKFEQCQGGLERRLFAIGTPKYAIKPLIRLWCKWERESGIEWTIKRLKSLKIDIIRRRTGQPPKTWVRKNRRGDVAGTVGSIFRWSDTSEENFSRAIQVFMAYTFYIQSGLTETQKEKFLSGINPETTSDGLSKRFHHHFKRTVCKTLKRRPITRCARPLVTYQGSPDKKAPRLFGRTSVPQSEAILDDLQIFNTPGGYDLYANYQSLYRPILFGVGDRRDWLDSMVENSRSYPNNDPVPVLGGQIHFIQEPGGKLRSIASPFRIHQEALRPLGEELYDVVRSLPWDCTFNQMKAIPHIQSHLSRGGQVHSIDLSSATDHFPLSLQLTALRAIIDKRDWHHIDLFAEISRGVWKSDLGDLKWTKGQPLGLFPSFAAFTLTHGLLLLHLAGAFKNQFFVVGDDVVIMDEKLHHKYMTVLDRMACPWSADKSISSNVLSEFAGKIITSERVIPQLKWRQLSDDNFLDICRLLGRRASCLLSRRQKVVYNQVAHLCEPIGLNQSLPGDNLEKMIERTIDFYQPVETVLSSLMNLRRKLNHLVYTSSEPLSASQLKEISATFDEKVKSVMRQTVYANWEVVNSIGIDAFDTLPSALDLKSRLPYKERLSSRQSTLERYERLLQTV